MWKQLSDELQTAAGKAARNLVHVGGPGIPGRTALAWSDGLAVTLARQARDGEAVPVVLPNSNPATATVQAWDARTGLTLLAVPGLAAPSWSHGGLPSLGSLLLTVAFASPQGAETRLDLVRFVGGGSDWGRGVTLQALLQTDGGAFPGFTGAAVINAEGSLVGFVAENSPGNSGFVVAVADLKAQVEKLQASGSPRPVWLGVSTRPGGQGLVLVSVESGSPADRAGWKGGDLLVQLAGTALREPDDLVRVLAGLEAGVEASAKLLRDGALLDLPVTPGAR